MDEVTGETWSIEPDLDHWEYVELKFISSLLSTPRRHYRHARWCKLNVIDSAVDCREKSAHIACNLLPIDDDFSLHADRPVLGAQSLTGLRKRKAREYAARLVGLGLRDEVIDTVAQF